MSDNSSSNLTADDWDMIAVRYSISSSSSLSYVIPILVIEEAGKWGQ